MKERNAKIIEIIFRSICVVSIVFIFICDTIIPMVIAFICYFLYKTIKEIIVFIRRIKQERLNKTVDAILLSERVICYVILILVFMHYLLK